MWQAFCNIPFDQSKYNFSYTLLYILCWTVDAKPVTWLEIALFNWQKNHSDGMEPVRTSAENNFKDGHKFWICGQKFAYQQSLQYLSKKDPSTQVLRSREWEINPKKIMTKKTTHTSKLKKFMLQWSWDKP